MAELLGKDAAIKITNTTVARMRSFSLTINGEVVDITEFGDDWLAQRPVINSWSASCEGMLDILDASQNALRAAVLAGTEQTALRFFIDGSKYYTGNCYISSFVINAEAKGLVTFTMNVVGSGALSYN